MHNKRFRCQEAEINKEAVKVIEKMLCLVPGKVRQHMFSVRKKVRLKAFSVKKSETKQFSVGKK